MPLSLIVTTFVLEELYFTVVNVVLDEKFTFKDAELPFIKVYDESLTLLTFSPDKVYFSSRKDMVLNTSILNSLICFEYVSCTLIVVVPAFNVFNNPLELMDATEGFEDVYLYCFIVDIFYSSVMTLYVDNLSILLRVVNSKISPFLAFINEILKVET